MIRFTAAFFTALLMVGCGNTVDRPDSARLPKSLEVPAAIDAAAAELARKVYSADEKERTRALLSAVERAGFAVRDFEIDKVVREPMKPSQGLALEAGEVLLISRLYERGYQVDLKDLTELLAEMAPRELRLTEAPLRDFFIDGIRTAAQLDAAQKPTQRFWARFIVELGKQGSSGYDLLDSKYAGPVLLDGAQTTFVLLRYAGDLTAFAHRADVKEASILPWRLRPSLLLLDGEKRACTMTSRENTAMDAGAMASTVGFGKMLDYFSTAAENAGNLSSAAIKMASIASAAGLTFGFLKFFMAGALTEAKLDFVDGSAQLERTRSNIHNGEEKELRATLRLNSGGLHYMNCLRMAMNAVGVDFNLGNDGPIEDATVSWQVEHAGGMDAALESARNAPFQFVGSDITRTKTNKAGEATVRIEGRKQRYQIPPNAEPVKKTAAVLIKYNLKESSLVQDLVDALGALGGGLTGSVSELLMRIMPYYARQTFTVVDWAADYKFDYTAGGVRFSGHKCDGPIGEWVINITDESNDGIGVRGSIFADVEEQSLRGRYAGNMDFVPDGFGGKLMRMSMQFAGRTAFNQTEPSLLLEAGAVRGSFSGMVHMPLGGPGGQLRLPLQVGSFCEGN